MRGETSGEALTGVSLGSTILWRVSTKREGWSRAVDFGDLWPGCSKISTLRIAESKDAICGDIAISQADACHLRTGHGDDIGFGGLFE